MNFGRRVLVWIPDKGIPALGASGASVHVRGILQGLLERGYSPVLAVRRLSDERPRRLLTLPVPVVVVPGALADAVEPPDWIWERLALDAAPGPDAAAVWGVPRLLEVNAPVVEERLQTARLQDAAHVQALVHASVVGAERVVVVSEWLARWVRGLGVVPERLRHVPNAASARPGGDREQTRSRLGWTGPVAGVLGSGRPWHGLERLPDIAALLPEWTIAVIGPSAPAHPRIVGLGPVPEEAIGEILQALDVGLVPTPPDAPSWFDPLKCADFRAVGLPVVQGVRPNSPPAWADAVRAALHAPRVPEPRTWATVVDEATAP